MPNFTQLESGVMANPENFSRVLHCPNVPRSAHGLSEAARKAGCGAAVDQCSVAAEKARACPGGALPKSPAQPMCAEGYDGGDMGQLQVHR